MDNDWTDYLFFGVMGTVGVVFVTILALVLVYLPANLKAQKTCLERGYPKHNVTYDFSAYCMNLDGVVTIKVEKP